MFIDPIREDAALDLADTDPQFTVVHTRADGIGAAQVLPIDGLAQGQVLALGKPKGFAQGQRHLKGDDHRLAGVGLDATDGQIMEQRCVAHIGLKCSKGSRQARQRHRLLQAVVPKADRRSVSPLSQRGQATDS